MTSVSQDRPPDTGSLLPDSGPRPADIGPRPPTAVPDAGPRPRAPLLIATAAARLPGPGGAAAFMRRQQRDWNVTVVRTSLDRLAYQIVFPYLSVYIVALGASATQLGLVNSLGLVAAGLVSPFIGWLIDRHGPRSFYLAGIGLLAVSYLSYAVAQSWYMAIAAMVAYWLGYSISGHSCATICGNCLVNRDRATAMMVCETVGAGFLGIVGPLIGAFVVASSGGVDPDAIRPLFVIGLGITVATFVIVLTQLSPQRWSSGLARGALFGDLRVVLRGRHRGRWLVIAGVGQLPMGMVFAFSQVYAYEVKGADAFVLGAMAATTALVSIVLAIPLGRLADRIGRKTVLFLTIPLFVLSNVVLIWAPTPAWLVLAGGLQAFFYLGGPVQAAMERELVPADQMGRWIGIARIVRLLMSAAMALVAGLIWDGIGPAFVFLAYVAIELLVRVPLLATMTDTLGLAPVAVAEEQRTSVSR